MMRNGSTNYRHKLFAVVLSDGQVVGRIFKHAGVLKTSRGSGQSLPASIRRRPQSRLFSDTRASDDGIQETVACRGLTVSGVNI